ncbi:uncharacterized protein LOC110179681 [Drosophila serrata]|uniref:uncharacterized protein LOC110179681 n=1 Tax=Drosophila serrata TaxID=7274 RepID=UPI000A1D0CBE|nr:uncharacterized protein LOC110179681 [Drosophila serrata]
MSSSNIRTLRNSGNISRYEIVAWINKNLQHSEVRHVEDLCTGVAYCRMMSQICPSCINLKQVKMMPTGKNDYEDNLCLLQDAFEYMDIKQLVPIDYLIQGRFKHNFEFIKTFKEIYEAKIKQAEKKKIAKPIKPKTSRISANRKNLTETKSSLVEIADKEENKKVQDVPEEDPMPMEPEVPMKVSRLLCKMKPTIKAKLLENTQFLDETLNKKEDPKSERKVQDVPEEVPMQVEPEKPIKVSRLLCKMKPAIKTKLQDNTQFLDEFSNKKEDCKSDKKVQDVLEEDPMPIKQEVPIKVSRLLCKMKPTIKAKLQDNTQFLDEISYKKEDPKSEMKVQDILDEHRIMMNLEMQEEPEIPLNLSSLLTKRKPSIKLKPQGETTTKVTDKARKVEFNTRQEVQYYYNDDFMMDSESNSEEIQSNEIQDNEVFMISSFGQTYELKRDILQFSDAPGLLESPYYYYFSPGWKGRRWRSEGFLLATHLSPS